MAKAKYFPTAITLFHIRDGFNVSFESVTEAVDQLPFREISKEAFSHAGFDSLTTGEEVCRVLPVGGFDKRPHNGGFVIKYCVESKIIPSDAVRRLAAKQINQIESAEARFVRGKERSDIIYEIESEMAMTAPTTIKQIKALVLPNARVMAVFSSVPNDIERVCSLLRKALGSLPIMPYEINDFIGLNGLVVGYGSSQFDDDVYQAQRALGESGNTARLYELGDSALLCLPYDPSCSIRYTGIFSAENEQAKNAILENGMIVKSIELSYSNAISSFVFHKDFKMTAIKWALESSIDSDADLPEGDLDANQYANLVMKADYELVSGVVTDLHQIFMPLFGDVARFDELAK